MTSQAKPRMLILTSWWPTVDGGTLGNFIRDQAMAFVNEGFLVDIVIVSNSRTNRRPSDFVPAAGVKISVVRMPRIPQRGLLLGLGLWLERRFLARKLRGWLRESAEEFVFTLSHQITFCGALARSALFGKVACVLHGEDPRLMAASRLGLVRSELRRNVARVDRFILVGPYLRLFADYLGVEESRVTVVPNGYVVEHILPPQKKASSSVRICSISNLTRQKRIDLNLRAIALCRAARPDTAFHYDVIGIGSERRSLNELAASLGVGDIVTFHGRLSRRVTFEILAQADIFSLPSEREAFGIVYLEAMHVGKPVIGVKGYGAAAMVRDGVDGVLVDEDDPEGLAKVISELGCNSALRAELGRNGVTRAREFTWQANVAAIGKLLLPPTMSRARAVREAP